MSTAVKRACDACHRRKVKCDGVNPCRNCASAQLGCTYNAIPQKKGPKGSRAKVISELRETQRQTSLSAKVQCRLGGMNSPPCSPSLSPTPGLLAGDMIKESLEFFFANMYPIMPILHRPSLEQQAMFMDQSLDTYCLLTSLCAFMMFQPGMNMPGGDLMLDHMGGANIVSGTLLLEESIRVRKNIDCLQSPSLNSLCTSYFLFCTHYALDMHDKAWFYLREATTLAHMCAMTKEEAYLQFDNVESSRRRRLFWLLFVTERAYALQRGRPLTLQASIAPPSITDDPTDPLAHQLNSFFLLVNLFKPFDDTFLTLWTKTRTDITASYLASLQKQLNEILPAFMNGQEADLRTNQQWLKTVNWHLAMQNGCIPQTNQDQYPYPIDLSRDLMSLTSQFQTQNSELLRTPFVAKLLEISHTLTEFLAMQPATGDPFTMGPREHLNSLLNLLSVLRSGDHHYLPLLLIKVHELLPRLTNPMLQRAPENSFMQSIDIFDGFGNAGMAQPPMITDFKSEPFSPSAAPHLHDIPAVDTANPNGRLGVDIKSPFPMVSSPGLTSPGVEFSHGHDFNPMPDIVMSPIGHGHQPSFAQRSSPQQVIHHDVSSQGMNSNHSFGGQMQTDMHGALSHGLNHQPPLPNIGHQHTSAQNHQSFNHMNSMLQRATPQRANSFMMHQHQQSQIPRTVADFHALQRANTDLNSSSLGQMQAEVDYSGLR